jgi:hypothetical protein
VARSTSISAGCFVALFLLCSNVLAHVQFSYPTPRRPGSGNEDIKNGPCGCSTDACPNGDVRNPSRVTVLEPGETITVTFNETVNHPGFYRISFDEDGQDAFEPPPLSRSAIQTGTPTLPVLLDDIEDIEDGMRSHMYEVEVTLPNVECENCTLQLIQVMVTDATWPEEEIYFTCADIALRASGGGTGGAGAGGMSAGGMPGGGMSAGGTAGGGTAGGGSSAGGSSAGGTAGTLGAGGAGAGGMATGGAGSGAGGAPSGGAGMASGATGGMAAGMPGTGGGPTAGAPATGGVGTGGVGTGGSGNPPISPPAEEGGCTISPKSRPGGFAWLLLGAGVAAAARRRRAGRAIPR